MCGELIGGPPEQIHSSAHTEFTASFNVHKHQVSPIIRQSSLNGQADIQLPAGSEHQESDGDFKALRGTCVPQHPTVVWRVEAEHG